MSSREFEVVWVIALLEGSGDIYSSWSVYGSLKSCSTLGMQERGRAVFQGMMPTSCYVNSGEPAGADPARLLEGLLKE